MTLLTRTGLVSSAALALVLLGAAGCGDDESSTTTATTISQAPTTVGDDDVTSSSSPATSSTTDPDGSTSSTGTSEVVTDRTTAPDDTPDTSDPTSTTAPAAEDALTARLPEIDGFERSVDLGDDSGFEGELCDGSTASVTPAQEAAVEYDQDSDGGAQFDIVGLAFTSAADAATFYEELTSTTAGCETDDLTIDEGTSSEIGDEGVVYRLTGGGDDVAMTGLLSMSLSGDEVWVLGQERTDSAPAVVDPVLDAFRTAVES